MRHRRISRIEADLRKARKNEAEAQNWASCGRRRSRP